MQHALHHCLQFEKRVDDILFILHLETNQLFPERETETIYFFHLRLCILEDLDALMQCPLLFFVLRDHGYTKSSEQKLT